jgi:glycerol-3-phosphate cytidylyltransferase
MRMKKALIVGGSNGLGAAIVYELQSQGCERIYILDRIQPLSYDSHVTHLNIDLSKDDLHILDQFDDIDILVIAAGIGRIAPFDTFSDIEIQKTFQINALAIIRIIHHFYGKLKGNSVFYCAIVSSIAGIVASPLFALYSATKAAVFRFVESINIELEKEGTENRILNVCPGTLQGTSFYGGQTDFSSLQSLSRIIVEKLKNRDTLFIPQYDEVYRAVINRYIDDAHQFGLDSYDYKINSGRVNPASKITVGYLSGTFDLFHIGHLNLLRRAKDCCDYLIVGVHKDGSHKKKLVFIPFEERCEILRNIRYVNQVIESKPEDMDVYKDIKYDFLFVGSDYKGTARFERYAKYFADKNVKIVYFPYTQGTSSTKLRGILDSLEREN